MNKIIAIIAIFIAAFCGLFPAANSDPSSTLPAPSAQQARGNRIARLLNLTYAQKAALKPILMNIRQQFMSIHQDKSLTADQKKQKIELLKSHIHARIDKILTPAQQHELGKLKAKFRQEHWHPGPDSTGQQ